MPEIKFHIDCGELHCGNCELLEDIRCNCLAFGWLSEDEEKGGYFRDSECIDAQVQAEAEEESEVLEIDTTIPVSFVCEGYEREGKLPVMPSVGDTVMIEVLKNKNLFGVDRLITLPK